MSSAAPHLAHGMSGEEVAPDWPPITEDEIARLLPRVTELEDVARPRLAWHSPRPFSAAVRVGLGSGADVVVKRHHRLVRHPADLEEEHGFVRALRAGGAPVPRVFGDGESTAFTEGDFVYEVHEAPPGALDLYRDAPSWTPYRSTQHATAAGRALARLHVSSAGYEAPPRRPLPLLGSLGVVTSGAPLASVASLARARPGLGDYLAGRRWQTDLSGDFAALHGSFAPFAAALSPLWTHDDWHPSNLLWSEDDVAAVIDFGLCNRTAALYDLATAIERACVDWLDHSDDRDVHGDDVRALLAGYHAVRPLSTTDRMALGRLLPLVHVDYALSEVEYFHAVVGSAGNAALAYEGYLLGHLAWFRTPAGRELCSLVEGT